MNKRKTVKIVVDNVAQQNARDFWQQFDNMQEKINNLQSKIDKAIEYINNQCTQLEGYGDYEINSEVKQELLDILKEDK